MFRYEPYGEKDRVLVITLGMGLLQQDPVPVSQSRTVSSDDADATSLPSGEKATALTRFEWPSSVLRQDPVPVSQSRTVSSPDADATSLPSGEKATALTQSEWPSSVLRQDPVPVSQSRTVLSSDADATSLPSGEKATALTEAQWPSSVCSEAFQSSCTFDTMVTHLGMWPSNVFRAMLISGVKIMAEEYSCSGAFSSIDRFRRAKRFAS